MSSGKTDDNSTEKLEGPDDSDVTKLHSEVNQIEQQRFVLTTVAITAFAGILSIVVYKSVPPQSGQVDAFRFLGSVVIIVVLTVLYLYGFLMKRVLRIYTTYLKAMGKSGWEADYALFRQETGNHRWYQWQRWHWGYDQGQAIVFLILAGTGCAYPLFLAEAYGLSLGPSWGLPLDLVAFFIFVVLVAWVMHPARRRNEEARFERRWKDLKGPGGPQTQVPGSVA